MNKISKELLIGIIAVVSIFILVFGINFLKGMNLFEYNRNFYAIYDNIGGLQEGSAVSVHGFKVGVVGDILFSNENIHSLIIAVNIDKKFNIPKNSVLKIVNQDLMGTKGISLILGDDKKMAQNGDTLFADIERSLKEEVNKQILPLKNKAEDLISSVDSIITVITAILDKDARKSLNNSLLSLDKTFSTMSNTMTQVNKIVHDNDENIERMINNLSTLSDELVTSRIPSLISNLEEITTKINNSEGTLGQLVNQDEVYDNLKKTTKELSELVEDIKKNPKRYINIFGSSKPYKKSK
ncbi:MAG: MlaD family protein [Bacteroidota bacterium]|nr:MlaD family protein [Bacteroidota bacterium]